MVGEVIIPVIRNRTWLEITIHSRELLVIYNTEVYNFISDDIYLSSFSYYLFFDKKFCILFYAWFQIVCDINQLWGTTFPLLSLNYYFCYLEHRTTPRLSLEFIKCVSVKLFKHSISLYATVSPILQDIFT